MQTRTKLKTFLARVAPARFALLFLFHAAIFAGSYVLAWFLRFDFGTIPPEFVSTFRSSFAVVLTVQLLAGVFLGFYRGWWRYVGLADVVRLVMGLTVALSVLLAAWYTGPMLGIDPKFVKSPRGVLLVQWAFSLLMLFGTRVMIRLGRDRFRPAADSPSAVTRVLIAGAGDAGETLAREIEHRPQLGMKVPASSTTSA